MEVYSGRVLVPVIVISQEALCFEYSLPSLHRVALLTTLEWKLQLSFLPH